MRKQFLIILALVLLPIKVFSATSRLIVFVHGFGGDAMIEKTVNRAKEENKDLFRASLGEFNAIYDMLKSNPSNQFAVFKYNTKKYSNIPAGRLLNLMLLGRTKRDSDFPHNNTIPSNADSVDEIHFVTLSNGNLVVREAVLQAHGIVDSKSGKVDLHFDKSPRPTYFTAQEFRLIDDDPKLKSIYSKSVAHDISPILGGTADARGALPVVPRFNEIDPFGPHMNWLFSEVNVETVNGTVKDRFTYFMCGDTFTRGVWDLMTSSRRSPIWESGLKASNAMLLQSWRKRNLQWFYNFERGRGAGKDRHIEYVSDFFGDKYCNYYDYVEMNEKLMKHVNKSEHGGILGEKLLERNNLKHDGYFAVKISPRLADVDFESMAEVHTPGTKYYDKLRSGFYNKKTNELRKQEEFELSERHTFLVYYRPLINRIVKNIESFK